MVFSRRQPRPLNQVTATSSLSRVLHVSFHSPKNMPFHPTGSSEWGELCCTDLESSIVLISLSSPFLFLQTARGWKRPLGRKAAVPDAALAVDAPLFNAPSLYVRFRHGTSRVYRTLFLLWHMTLVCVFIACSSFVQS